MRSEMMGGYIEFVGPREYRLTCNCLKYLNIFWDIMLSAFLEQSSVTRLS